MSKVAWISCRKSDVVITQHLPSNLLLQVIFTQFCYYDVRSHYHLRNTYFASISGNFPLGWPWKWKSAVETTGERRRERGGDRAVIWQWLKIGRLISDKWERKTTPDKRGHTYMASAVGGGRGSPKSRRKERGCMNTVCDKGGGGHPKILRTFYKYRP